jgi:ubiquinone/menaquinone biosynthesis C-methylase UbiE
MNDPQQKVLNVGGNSKKIAIPAQYDGWQHDLLDIDPSNGPDIIADAREISALPAASYDAVYCSHNLEHYYLHDARKVLAGFKHVLKPAGHAYIQVPDIQQLMQHVVAEKLDILDVLYQSRMGPIRVCDVLYGHQGKIEDSGEEYFAHKMGYMPASLQTLVLSAGFAVAALSASSFNVTAIAFMQQPTEKEMSMFDIKFQN